MRFPDTDTPSSVGTAQPFTPRLRPLSVIEPVPQADLPPQPLTVAVAQAVYLGAVAATGLRRLQGQVFSPVTATRLGIAAAAATLGLTTLTAPVRAAPGNSPSEGPGSTPAENVLTVVIQEGDTLAKLSERYYGSPDHVLEIAKANGIADPDKIFAGATLKLPNLRPASLSAPSDTMTVVVQPGDTLRKISRRVYGDEAQFRVIAQANGLRDPDKIYAGTTLKIPAKIAGSQTQPLGFSDDDRQGSVRTAGASSSTAPATGFIWPARGVTVPGGEYGAPRGGGGYPKHTGLDLAAPQGTAVVAAAAGRVVHAGPEGSYGNTVVIDHGNGYKTRYAHLLSWKVSVNATVNQGQLIGLVGSTGYSTGPHLHFEVMKDGKFLDPRTVLPRDTDPAA